MYIADLHIHSKYSMATSRDCDAAHLDLWAKKKGIDLIGTGDFTHPKWREELIDALYSIGDGTYALKQDKKLELLGDIAKREPRFVISGEISTIYKKDGKTRKVHSVILLPSIEDAERLSKRLEAIGNIRSDGRPILGLDARDLSEMTFDCCPDAIFIPAHIWTPHFSVLGSFSGFSTIDECFGDMAKHIFAVETGLSSDPEMNHMVSSLDKYTLVSNSDAHSPQKLGREANIIGGDISYKTLKNALETGNDFLGTIEFFPEEGKYHLDGHRNCGVCLEPKETVNYGGICPVCGKKLTVGVANRVFQLSDRKEGILPENAKPFESIAPLPEIIASSLGVSPASKKVNAQYEDMLKKLGDEFSILRSVPLSDIKLNAGEMIAEGIKRLREGKVKKIAGYDGKYGEIIIFDKDEREDFLGQLSMFELPNEKEKRERIKPNKKADEEKPSDVLESENKKQDEAIYSKAPYIAVIAGPGTGKTHTLTARIAHLIESGENSENITAVTFTNQAAREMRERLSKQIGEENAAKMQIGTFHSICLKLLDPRPIIEKSEAVSILSDLMEEHHIKCDAKKLLGEISKKKSLLPAEIDESLYLAYVKALCDINVRDLDDIICDALDLSENVPPAFDHLFVDEFQDINAVQRQLIFKWSKKSKSLFVIGDADQSIYGFRGASADCFDELKEQIPELKTIRLEMNYRSCAPIIESALKVIDHNKADERKLIPKRQGGAAVKLIRAKDPYAQGDFIAEEISRLVGGLDMLSAKNIEAKAFSDIAVLARTHSRLKIIEDILKKAGIPCTVQGRSGDFDSNAVSGAAAFLRYLINRDDTSSMQTAVKLLYGLSGYKETTPPMGLLADIAACESLINISPSKTVQRLMENHPDLPELSVLLDTSTRYDDLSAMLFALSLGHEQDMIKSVGKKSSSGTVRLMTLHGSKGLEFPVVFLSDFSNGVLPLERIDDTCDIEEERRLLFVGMTRAKDKLIITGTEPLSCFEKELPKSVERIKLSPPKPKAQQLSLF